MTWHFGVNTIGGTQRLPLPVLALVASVLGGVSAQAQTAIPEPRAIARRRDRREARIGEEACLVPRNDTPMKAFVDQWLHLAEASGGNQRTGHQWLQ